MTEAICDRLNHRVLPPSHNPLLDIQSDASGFTVRYQHKPYVFTHEDVVQLPVPNTTAEHLAALATEGTSHLTTLEVEVEETVGQSAFCCRELSHTGR
jgi:hypothetical protein